MSATEPGHQENVDNLGIFIHQVQTLGDRYQPSNSALTVENLLQTKASGMTSIASVLTANQNHNNDIATRTFILTDFDHFITRVANTIKGSNAKQQSVDQAMSLIREIRGQRVTPLASDQTVAAAKEKGVEITQITKHNASMKSQTVNFGKLNVLLGTMPEYNPNEADLKLSALVSKQAAMSQQNDAVDTSASILDSSRVARTHILYDPTTGVVNVGNTGKLYVKAAFGADSPEYKLVSDIKFVNRG